MGKCEYYFLYSHEYTLTDSKLVVHLGTLLAEDIDNYYYYYVE